MRDNGVPVCSTRIEDDEQLDSELAQALESYLAAVEAGQPVDLERLAAEHPAIAHQLRSCLAVLRLAGRVEGNSDAKRSSASDDRGDVRGRDSFLEPHHGGAGSNGRLGRVRFPCPKLSCVRFP